MLAAVGLSRKVLAKNNIFLGYKIDDNSSVSLRAENEGYRKDPLDLKKIASQPLYLFDHIKLDYIRKVDDIKVGVEVLIIILRGSLGLMATFSRKFWSWVNTRTRQRTSQLR